jgi:hypothetical protein
MDDRDGAVGRVAFWSLPGAAVRVELYWNPCGKETRILRNRTEAYHFVPRLKSLEIGQKPSSRKQFT